MLESPLKSCFWNKFSTEHWISTNEVSFDACCQRRYKTWAIIPTSLKSSNFLNFHFIAFSSKPIEIIKDLVSNLTSFCITRYDRTITTVFEFCGYV